MMRRMRRMRGGERVCGGGGGTTIKGSDETYIQGFTSKPSQYINNRIEEEKNKYPNVTDWYEAPEQERTFFLSCRDDDDTVGLRDVLVVTKETFIYPSVSRLQDSGFVKDIINLDNSQEIYVKVKNIPRKIKTLDPLYNEYDYDTKGNIIPSTNSAVGRGGYINCGFPAWMCISLKDGNYIETPDFFKMQNEMIFRAFFSSVDGIEHKNTNIVGTKEFWEWIPYEYYN
jgi:hypothetical protein